MANLPTVFGRERDEAQRRGLRRRGAGEIASGQRRHPPGRALGLAKRQPSTSPFVRPVGPPSVLFQSVRTAQPAPLVDVMTGRVSSAMTNTLPATIRRPPNVPANYALGDDEDDFAQFGGFSLRSIGRAFTAVGHTIGTAVTSKVGQGILGGALALTGVGAPAAAAIFATTKGVGNLIKPGGNIKHFVTGAAQGAIEGVASNLVGKAGRAVVSHFTAGNAATVASKVAPKVLGGGTTTSSVPTDTGGSAPFQVNDAAMAAAINAAASHAEDASASVAQQQQQVAGIQAQQVAASTTGNDAASAALAAQLAEAQQQLAIAQQAATQAQTAAGTLANSGGGLSGGQVAGLVGSAAAGSAAAQVAAAAQPTPDGTAAAAQAADVASQQDMSASGDTPSGGLLSHPVLLLGGLAAVVLIAGKKRRKRHAQAA